MCCRCSAGRRRPSPGWLSEIWRTRRGRLFLVPGDSAIGLRLPLDALPYLAPADYPHIVPADPMEPRGALPDPEQFAADHATPQRRTWRRRQGAGASPRAAGVVADVASRGRSVTGPVRTALTVEPREGRLCVFMPPVERLEDYLELLAAVEATAAAARPAGPHRRLRAAGRSAARRHQGDARSRRDRGQHPSGRRAGASGRAHARALRGGAALPARRRQVHDRRPAHRHRRRQSRRGRRRAPSPTARSCAGPTC